MSVALFTQVWASCVGPAVAVETGAAVARAESGFNTLAIHDNTTGRNYEPPSLAEATAVARALTAAGNSLDLGVMQIDSANLARLGLTVVSTFDPCRNMAAGAQILLDDYLAGHENRDVQMRLQQALSRYNTGDGRTGFANGYVARVQAAAGQIVPAIRLRGDGSDGAPPNARHADATPQAAADDSTSLIDGLIHPDTGADDRTTASGNSDDALIHAGDPHPPSESPSAPPPSQASPRPSG